MSDKETKPTTKGRGDGRNRDGTFARGYAGGPGRPVGSVNALLRQARDAAENIALPMIIEAARNGDMFAARTLVQLGLPKQRPVAVAEQFPLTGETLTDKAASLIELVSTGIVSSQTGGEVVGMLATAAKIEEVEQLREQVERFKMLLGERKNKKKAAEKAAQTARKR